MTLIGRNERKEQRLARARKNVKKIFDSTKKILVFRRFIHVSRGRVPRYFLTLKWKKLLSK